MRAAVYRLLAAAVRSAAAAAREHVTAPSAAVAPAHGAASMTSNSDTGTGRISQIYHIV